MLLVSWDVSGDQNGGRLAAALRRLAPATELFGAGGEGMEAAGVDVRVRTNHLSFTGVLASASMIRGVVDSYVRVRRLVDELRPDLVVLIDAEFATMRLARRLRRLGIPAVFFFPPQFWVLGRWRVPSLVPLARKFLCAFRDEAELLASAGADATWMGHPLRDAIDEAIAADGGRRALVERGLDPARPLVLLLPGSRRAEVRRLAPAFLGAGRELQKRDPSLQFGIPLADESLRATIEAEIARSGLQATALLRPGDYAVFRHARAAIQKSGTASLEIGMLGVPALIVYRMSTIEYLVGWYVLSTVKFIGMVNILLGDEVQPEVVQKGVSSVNLARAAWPLLHDESRRRSIQDRLAQLPALLGPPGAIDRAAACVIALAQRRP